MSDRNITHWNGKYYDIHECHATQLTDILQDLIAELRDAVKDYPPTVFREFTDDDPATQSRTVDRIAGVAMRHAWTRAGEMADRAEARLRELGPNG